MPTRIRALDGMRVIGEYFVVRHHVLADRGWSAGGPLGLDIMSFFFVLSGFVTMWISHDEDLSNWRKRMEFVTKRAIRFAPIFALNYAVGIPNRLFGLYRRGCWLDAVCPILQFAALDSWCGCGFQFILNAPCWFLSTMIWQWVFWADIKDWLLEWLEDKSKAWKRIYTIALLWLIFPMLLIHLDVYTISCFPIVRFGEFLAGSGVACVLLFHRDAPPPWWLQGRRFWYPFAFVIFLYNLQTLKHGMSFLCLGELAEHSRCDVWQQAQKDSVHGLTPPCLTLLDKVVNKYTLVWAGIIYGVARAELTGEDDHWTMRVLQADVFQFLSKFSITLYLSHINVWIVVRDVVWFVLGWRLEDWRDDTVLFCTYLGCYGVHVGALAAVRRFWEWRASKKAPVVEEADDETTEDDTLMGPEE